MRSGSAKGSRKGQRRLSKKKELDSDGYGS